MSELMSETEKIKSIEKEYKHYRRLYEQSETELAHYKKAENEGRLRISPVQEHEVVWCIVEATIRTYEGIYQGIISTIDYNHNFFHVMFAVSDQPCGFIRYYFSDWGKTIFHTRDEAEEEQNSENMPSNDEYYRVWNHTDVDGDKY